jgi:uncharacterized protein YdeI (YjbR/CyaY-like superfamily)
VTWSNIDLSAYDPVLTFPSDADWEAWLDQHHADSDGVWIKIAKKSSGIPTVAYPEVLDTALCFGWIDGQRKALDERYFLQRFTPRRARSKWSKINRDKVTALTEAERMRPAGLAEVERAKADGRWDAAYDGQARMTVPDDLQAELDARPAAAAFFAQLSSQNRYSILFRLHDAKRPETRARRLAKFVAMLEAGETIY